MQGKGLFITGTDTGVGKTQVTFGLAAALNQRFKTRDGTDFVTLWKPVQTGTQLGFPDADSYRLRHGSGLEQAESDLVTVTLPEPLAPWMAAKRADTSIDYESLVDEGLQRQQSEKFLLVEGAGGLAVPLTDERVIADLARELNLPLLIVARAGLGTVNHTLLTLSYAERIGIKVAGVILNGYIHREDPALQENVMMIEQFGGTSVVGMLPWMPWNEDAMDWISWREQWRHIVDQAIDWNQIIVNTK